MGRERSNPESEDESGHEEKGQSAGDIMAEFWEGSTLQGLPRVFMSTVWFWKFFWLVLFLALVSGCVYQMSGLFIKYYSYSTATSVTLQYDHLPLPSITICNLNHIRHSKLLEHGHRELLQLYQNNLKPPENETTAERLSMRLQLERQTKELLYSSSSHIRQDLGHQQFPLIVSCVDMEAQRFCNRNFTLTFSPEYGNCFTLNSGQTQDSGFHVTKSGINGGIDLYLYTEEMEYLRRFHYSRGFRMEIHGYNTLSLVEEHPMAISPGAETFINLKLINISRLQPPYGQCDQEYVNSFEALYGSTYTVAVCNATCMHYRVADQCGCMLREPDGYRFHTSEQQQKLSRCLFEDTCFWYTSDDCKCPLPCSETVYEEQITSAPWGTAEAFDDFKEIVCREQGGEDPQNINANCAWMKNVTQEEKQNTFRKNFARVHIYFENLMFNVLEEQATYGWSQFMADFGGNVGLWIGASIFTILEFVEFFTKLFVYRMQGTSGGSRGPCRGARKQLFKDTSKKKRRSKSSSASSPRKMNTSV